MRDPGTDAWILRLEYEGHEHTNRVRLNGQTIGYLPSQTWADMWMSAALPVPVGLLRAGYNELALEVGCAIPDCQTPGSAWDELLFRHVRLSRRDAGSIREGCWLHQFTANTHCRRSRCARQKCTWAIRKLLVT